MNKNLKIVSSVALAGMLALNVYSPKALARTVEDNTNTQLAGTYKNMAQFVLVDATDYVTYKEIANSGKFINVESFKGSRVVDDNELVRTGDTFVADGKEYTAVIYGDVNGDGLVNPSDAAEVLKSYTGTPLTGVKAEAANVARSTPNHLNNVNPTDAANILKFYTGSNVLVDGELQHDEEEQIEEDENFSITLADNATYFNNTNISDPQFKIKVEKPLTDDKNNLHLKIEGVDVDGNSVNIVSTAKVSFTTNLNEITLDFDTPTNIKKIVGRAKITLLDKEEKVVRTTTIENKTADTSIANVRTNRVNSIEATISFEGMGKYDVKNVYYLISTSAISGNPDGESEKIVVSGNKVTNVALKGLTAEGAHNKYNIKMLVEDIYGNISSANTTPEYVTATVLTEEEQANQQDKVNVTLDKTITNVIHFDVKKLDGTTNNDQDLKYVLYKDGKIIKEDDVTSNKEKIEISSSDLDGVGTYKVSVVAKGDGSTSSDSEATEATFEVKKLNPVSNITLAKTDDDKFKINWTKSTEESATEYDIAIYDIAANGNINTTAVSTISNVSVNTIEDISTAISSKDKAYVAKIITKATNNVYYVDSEEKTSNQIVVLSASSLSLGTSVTTSDSITFTPKGMKNIPGVTSTYTLKVYNDNGANLGLATRYTLLKEINNPIDENGKIVVDGLQPGKAYGFDLIEKIGDVENITSTISGAILSVTTKAQAPVVNGLTVVKSATPISVNNASEYVGKIAIDSTNNVFINGVVYNKSIGDYSRDVAKIVDVLAGLYDGDKITINENVVTLDLVNATETRNFGIALNGKTVIVNCDTKVEKDLTMTAPTKVTLQGNGALYDVSAIGTRAVIEVDRNVANIKATDSQALELLQNVSTTINGVNVSTKVGTKVVINNSTKAVTVNVDESKTDSELSFENNGNITFKTTDTTNKTTLAGTVKINTTKAVTIATTGVAVDASINVISAATVTDNATTKVIDLTAPRGLNGTKSVTVNKDAKSTVKFNVNQHIVDKDGNNLNLSNGTILKTTGLSLASTNTILQSWEADGLISAAVDGYYNETEVNVAIAQLSKFGIDDANASLIITSNVATITFTDGATKTVTIGNIK